jgi:hypothetical protein
MPNSNNKEIYDYLKNLIARSSDSTVPSSVTVLGVTFNAPGGGNLFPQSNQYLSENCKDDQKIQISPNYNLAQLSCASPVAQFSIPKEGQTKTHPTYGILTRSQIIKNLTNLAINIIEPIKKQYPTVIITNAYRNKGGKSQHEAGMAVDIQFSDINGPLSNQNSQMLKRAIDIEKLLNNNYDQFLLEYKTDRGGRPWIHISYNDNKNRKDKRTFLNDKTASNGINNFYNPLI